MKNDICKEIRHLRRLIKIYRAKKNWLQVDHLKHKVQLAIKEAKQKY